MSENTNKNNEDMKDIMILKVKKKTLGLSLKKLKIF